MVESAYRKGANGLPFDLIVESTRFQIERGVKLTFCDCQPHLLNLYMRLGFQPYAPTFDQPGFGMMVPLLLILSDFRHLRFVHSPLLRYFPENLEDTKLASLIGALLPSIC
jgi:hypothetical protein